MNPTRVLIYRIGSLGDTIVALPCFHLIARAFPNANRRLLSNFPVSVKAPPAAAILQGAGLVHGYLRYTIGTRSPFELTRLWWHILRFRPQILVYLNGARGVRAARRDALFFRICGVQKIIGLPDTEAAQQCLPQPDGQLEFEAQRLARNLAALGPANLDDPASWDLRLTPEEQQRAATVLAPAGTRPVIAVSVGTKVQAKDWGIANWSALIGRLAALYPGHALALCGAPEEREASSQAAAAWQQAAPTSPAINLCGDLTPRESAAVFARARVFIGHDSGPMHLAAAVQTPCVAVFASRNIPRTWFPYGPRHQVLYHPVNCMGCELETCIVEKKKCILSISIDEVLTAVAELGL